MTDKDKIQQFIDAIGSDIASQYEKAYMESVITGEGWLKVHPDGHIEYIQRFFGCGCGETETASLDKKDD